jgi:flavin reductase (DIM6/NTAB) family NADH-FMN oxidoreductase RutF
MLTVGFVCAACGNKEQKSEQNANENPAKEKIEVKQVEGRKNFSDKTVITPLPAIMIATWDADKNPDVMMAAWGGQCGPKHICFNLSPHKTTENLKLKNAFTVSFATKSDIVESDYFGIVAANDVPDKVKKAGFTITPSPNVDAPIINEYKLTLECRVIEISETSLNETRVVGEIVNMSADESILNEEGNIDLDKLQPVIFDSSNNTYRVVGEKVGQAWGSGKAIQEREVK